MAEKTTRRHARLGAFVEAVRSGLEAAADPAKAPGMQAYMKSAMPYYGVNAPAVRKVCREVFAAHPLEGFREWHCATETLWRGAERREERYVAIELTDDKRYREHQTLATIPLYEEMIVTGAWWDYVDAVAIHRIGSLLRAHPVELAPLMREWSTSEDIWKRRTAIISQVASKTDTDLELLYDCIEPNLADKEFFVRKAIGWALRSYAWIDPDEVVRYVESVDDRISGLSRREALKNLPSASSGGFGGRK